MRRTDHSAARRAAAGAALALAAAAVHAAPQVILPSQKKVVGTDIRADEKGTIFLTTAQGVLQFPAGTTVVVDEPSGYTAAVSSIQRRQYDAAIKSLREVMERYRFLVWDKKAEKLVATAFFGKGDYVNAVATYERVFAHSPQTREEPDVKRSYLEALLGAGEVEKLKPILDETIRISSREVAAQAQIMRGRMHWEDGSTDSALMDFMRTAELFPDAAEFQAEAHFRTAECLEKLGDPRARDFYQRVANEFAASEFAAQAKAKL